MAMGEDRRDSAQGEFWIETQNLVKAPGHPFYQRLNRILKDRGFNAFASGASEKFYKEGGRPSVPPPIYFRMLMIENRDGWVQSRI